MSRFSTRWGGERERKRQFGWIEQTLSGISHTIEQAVFTEEHARKSGWLQARDPRAKLVVFLMLVLAASLTHTFIPLMVLYVLLLLAARLSLVPFDFFVRRVWVGIPFFAGIVVLPSIFFTSAGRLFDVPIGPFHFGPSVVSMLGAVLFVARVGVCVSLAVLLILTTPWADILKSLQAFRVPQVFILLLSMTYRYIFLFLHTANGMFEARKSRTVGRSSGQEQRRWVSASISTLMNRSFQMSQNVYAAMAARGFTGEVRTYSNYHMNTGDWLLLGAVFILAVIVVFLGGYLL